MLYVSWTAGRLDRLHARVDAAWAALDAQLAPPGRRRAGRGPRRCPPARRPCARRQAARSQPGGDLPDREALRERPVPRAARALPLLPPHADRAELDAASTRVGLARSFHNAAVRDTRAVRLRRLPRALRLAGHRALPEYFEIDDTAIPR